MFLKYVKTKSFFLGVSFALALILTLFSNTSAAPGVVWTARDSVRTWASITSSSDGVKLAATADRVYTSTDSGATWTPRGSSLSWQSIASSADGVKLVASTNAGVYTSTDSGVTWVSRISTGSSGNWTSVASSADGSKLIMATNEGRIYTSADSGVTWTLRSPAVNYWSSVASSADGTKLMAATNGGNVYVSTDSGATWTPRGSSLNWISVAMSSDGSLFVGAVYLGGIYVSTDFGVTWSPRAWTSYWASVDVSADGSRIVAVDHPDCQFDTVYASEDFGSTWTDVGPNSGCFVSVTASTDATKIAIAGGGSRIHTGIGTYTGSTPSGNALSGFAWSSTIGWISLSSLNDHDDTVSGVQTSPVSYGVSIDPQTGNLLGNAWSSNVGWIQFGGLSGFPSGTSTTASNAKLVGSNIVGWAKALSANGFGWDGWISLTGANHGVTRSGSSLSGFAWGSDVVGWIDFSGVSFDAVGFPTVTFDTLVGGTSVKGRADVEYGSNVTLSWALSNLPSGTTCTVSKISSGGTAFTAISGIATSSTASTGPLTQGSYTYQFDCQDGAGYSSSQSASFDVLIQYPGFSIGGPEDIKLQTVGDAGTDSETKRINVVSYAGYTGNVTISLGGLSPALPASTTMQYSLGGSSFTETPGSITLPYNGVTNFTVRINKKISNACSEENVPVGCTWYYITLNATGESVPSRTKVYRVKQSPVSTRFEEI